MFERIVALTLSLRGDRGDIATWLSYGLGALIVAAIAAAIITGVPGQIGNGIANWVSNIFGNPVGSV